MKNYSRLAIYDFDGTLFRSPGPEEGSDLYFDATGNYWPHQGWWGRVESLLPPIIPNPIPQSLWIEEVVSRYRQDIKDQNAFVVLMTGRPYKNRHRIQEILKDQNLEFHKEYYRGMKGQKGRDTFDIKVNIIEQELFHDNLKIVEIFEDRPEHLSAFMQKAKKWISSTNLSKAIIHDVPNSTFHEFKTQLSQTL